MTDAVLPDDLAEARDAVRAAAVGVTARYDREYWVSCARDGRFPDAMWRAMADQGLLGLGVPEELGGSGGGLTELVAAMEAISAAGTPVALFLLTAFARETILRHGTPEQHKDLVAPTASGDVRMCFAITEPDAGTNSFAMSTTVRPGRNGGFLVSGQKTFISGADAAHRMMVVGRAPDAVEGARPGLTLAVIDTDAAGVDLVPQDIGKIGRAHV